FYVLVGVVGARWIGAAAPCLEAISTNNFRCSGYVQTGRRSGQHGPARWAPGRSASRRQGLGNRWSIERQGGTAKVLPMLNPNTTITTGTTPQASLIHPGHELYDVARASWNLAIDQRPACICVATEVEHVQGALSYARDHGLTVASQSTGHLSETL